MKDAEAAEIVARFEMAVLESAHLQAAYRAAELVAGTKEALTGIYNASADAQRRRDGCRLALLEALTGKELSNEEDPGNVWKGAETPFADNH